jgi:hypothetical protein
MVLILFLILSAVSAPAAESYAAWKYRGRIDAPDARFVALQLHSRNLDLCEKSDLSDFRIVDARGAEVPYAVVFETDLQLQTDRRGTELNREYTDAATSRITVDFGTSVAKNSITVETAGNNFRRFLQVEGSDDLRAWSMLLPEGWLIAAGDSLDRRFESFETGSNTYRYMRFSVRKMPEEEEPPRIVRVTCRHTVTRKAPETPVQSTLLGYGTQAGTSTIEIDFGARNLPVRRFQLLLNRDPFRIFEKRCHLYGRNSLQHLERIRFESGEYSKERAVETPWDFLGSGVVYRNAQSSMSLELPVASRCRYVRIRIENGDSPPLEISGVTGYTVPAYLVFEPAGQSRFDVYAGNATAAPPRYESSRALASLDTRNMAKCPVTLDAQSGAIAEKQPRGQLFVWGILVAVVLFTAWVFWNTARNIRKQKSV